MAKLERSYVIDFAVSDFVAACETFASIFDVDGVRMNPEKDSSGQLDGMHFPVGGVNAVGVMTARVAHRPDSDNHMARFLGSHGEGINILGHLVDDIDGYAAQLLERGVKLAYPTPVPYEDGRLIISEAMHGVSFEFAQHHSDQVTNLWRHYYDENPQRRVRRALRVDVAVRDLDEAAKTFAIVLGLEPQERTSFPANSRSVKGVDFAVGGLRALGLVALDGDARDPFAAAAADELDRRGDGGLLMSFEVDDLGKSVSELQAKGVPFLFEAEPDGDTRCALTAPLHGVRVQLTEVAA